MGLGGQGWASEARSGPRRLEVGLRGSKWASEAQSQPQRLNVSLRDATSSVYDYYLCPFLSVTWLINHFSMFLIGWSRDSF